MADRNNRKLKLVIPKGSLEDGTLRLFEDAEYEIRGAERSYRPWINDPEIELKVLRPQEIPSYVADGSHDLGISGYDWMLETKADVEELSDLKYGDVRIVLAVPEKWRDVKSFDDLMRKFWKRGLRIATEYLVIGEKYVSKSPFYKRKTKEDPLVVTPWYTAGNCKNVRLVLSFGATEAKPPEDADAIIENTTTGQTIGDNKLKIVDTVLDYSTARLIANRKALADPFKGGKMREVQTALEDVVRDRESLHIFANVSVARLREVIEILPARKNVSVAQMSPDQEWVQVNTFVPRDEYRAIRRKLEELGVEDITHYRPGEMPGKLIL